jgi:hypothetical protein
MRYNILLAGILLFFCGCNSTTDEKQKDAFLYFDIRGYFKTEANRLAKTNPLVTKTVAINDVYEKRELKISNWQSELSSISNADINKASWKGAFKISRSENKVTYSSNDKKIPVKELTVFYKDGKASGFQALIRNSNTLYVSTDSLSFYPDSLYRIKKNQQIKLLPAKNYEIAIKFR